MARRVRLRRFVYLDDDLTSDFLAQLEGGLFEEENRTTTTGRERKGGAGASAGPIQANIGGSRASEDVTSRTIKQVAEGAFTRLVAHLETNDALQWLEAIDDAIWRQLRRGEVLELEVSMSVPVIFQFGSIAGSAEPIMELMRATGESVDPEAEQGMQMLGMISQLFKNPVAIASLSGTPEYRFILPLEAAHLRSEIGDLSGDMTVLGTLERKLRDGETWSLVDAMGLGGLPNADELAESMTDEEIFGGSTVHPPAAVVKPVAIYR